MALLLLSFLGVFLLVGSVGLLVFYREGMLQRLAVVIAPKQERATIAETIQTAGSSFGAVLETFDKVIPKSQNELSVMQQRLIRAGFRSESVMKLFYGSKVLVPLVLSVIVFATGLGAWSPFMCYLFALGLGYLAPDFWLGRKISSRQSKIALGLPDLLDLLVICVEAGLGLDQATARAAQELVFAHPEIADELDIVVLEQRAGRPRGETWKNMADRTEVEVVRNLVSMIVQSEQFGTGIAKMLRTHSETLRTQRIQAVEEMAAKTTVKLIFPLVLFIFPCLFLVTLGPAVIMMSEQFKTFLH